MKKLQHEENMESERTMETRNKCNAERVRPEESIETEQNLEKSAKEECTIVHKRITGRPLMDHYTLVNFSTLSQLEFMSYIKLRLHLNLCLT